MSATATRIHPTAVIHPTAKIAEGVEIAPYAVIGEDVILHPKVTVGAHAIVEFAEVGEGCQIFPSSFVGTAPQDLKYRGERTRISLGPNCVVRECVTLNRGTSAAGITRIGARCLFMAYSHVAHDCIIGNEVIMANCVAAAGHVEIGDSAVIGGLAAMHQFVRVGKLAMVGGGSMVTVDVPPFALAQGDRAKLNGLNLLGLRRHGFSASDVSSLKKAYRDLYSSAKPVAELLQEMSQSSPTAPVKELIEFLQKSSRGFCRPANKKSLASEE